MKRGPLADPRAQEQMRQAERVLSDQEEEDLVRLMSQPWGRRLYYRLAFELCHLESRSYDASGQRMAFLEGRRDIGITLMNEALRHCPQQWVEMISERASAAAERQKAIRDINAQSREDAQ